MQISKQLTFLAAAIVAVTGLAAQETTGTILGTVREPNGRPSVRATIIITGDAILGSRTLATDENGNFRITLLPAGNYTITVSKQGFVGSKATTRVNAGQMLRQDFSLREMAIAAEEVEIVAASSMVDKTETKTSTTFTASQLATLPVALSSYGALALSPGVSGATDYPVVRGGLTGETNVKVDGINIKDPSVRQVRNFEYVMSDMTEGISVIQSPLNAKYGDSAGGEIAITSKSGKNYFEGTFRVIPDINWNAQYSGYRNRIGSATLANPTIVPDDTFGKEYVITILGPIIPDHLTFSYSGNFIPSTYATDTAGNLATTAYTFLPNFPGYTGSRNAYLYGATPDQDVISGGNQDSITQQYKLFWMITQNHQAEVLFSRNDFGPYFVGGLTYDTFGSQSSIRELTSVNYRGIIGSNGILEARWGRRRNEIDFQNGPDDPIYVRVWQNNPAITSFLTTTGTATILTNGYSGNTGTVLRNSETISVNYNWFNGKHNVDVGFEQLKDLVNETPQYGINARMFYVPGHRDDHMYAVYNYVGSDAQTGDPVFRNNAAFVPEMRSVNYVPGGVVPEFLTNSVYVNDLWTINKNWSVMAGLRLDMWQTTGLYGKYVDSKGISPRLEIKYDMLGDNQHLFTGTFGHFRPTLGSGSMGSTFTQRPGQIATRYFWDKGAGTPTAPEWVTKEDILTPANYGFLYSVEDQNLLYGVDPNLKPAGTNEITFSYRRSFANGGSFRATAIYRTFTDIWNATGTGIPVMTNTELQTYGGYFTRLEIDPDAKREHKGIELEWQYPLYRSATQYLSFQGSWTINRTKGTNVHREGNAGTVLNRAYALWSALGIPEEEYNPYGEYRFSPHNVVKAWLVWSLGDKGGITNTFSLLGNYTHGGPFNITATRNLNTADPAYDAFFERTIFGTRSSVGIPTSFATYLNGRGRFTDSDTFYVDFKWNFTIPIKGRLQAFSEITVGNIFNTVIPNGSRALVDGAVSMRFPVASGNWAYNYTGGMTIDQFDRFGLVNSRAYIRSFSLECGLRF